MANISGMLLQKTLSLSFDNFPGFTNKIEGHKDYHKAYMDWFAGYTNVLHSADNLRGHKSAKPENEVILEYEVHGIVPHTGKPYNNRFCSIITIEDRKIIHWRDYMDSLALMHSVSPDWQHDVENADKSALRPSNS